MHRAALKAWIPALALCLVSSLALAKYSPVELDRTHSQIGFTASTLLFDVDGQFNQYTVEIDGSRDKPEAAKVKVTIPVASIDTDNEKRDNHLKSDDFFHAQKYPNITFKSTKIESKGDQLIMTGTLSMHGKSKQVTIPFSVAKGVNGAGVPTVAYKGKLTIDRNDFGIGTDSIAAKISLKDEVELSLLLVMPQ